MFRNGRIATVAARQVYTGDMLRDADWTGLERKGEERTGEACSGMAGTGRLGQNTTGLVWSDRAVRIWARQVRDVSVGIDSVRIGRRYEDSRYTVRLDQAGMDCRAEDGLTSRGLARRAR